MILLLVMLYPLTLVIRYLYLSVFFVVYITIAVQNLLYIFSSPQVPADGVLIIGHSLSIDESSMTGESKIVSLLCLLSVPLFISNLFIFLKLYFIVFAGP